MQNINTTDSTQTEPEPKASKDCAEGRDTKPLKLDADEVEERIVPIFW